MTGSVWTLLNKGWDYRHSNTFHRSNNNRKCILYCSHNNAVYFLLLCIKRCIIFDITYLSISKLINCALRVMNKNDWQSCRTLNKHTEILLSLASIMYYPPKWIYWRLMLSKYTLVLVRFLLIWLMMYYFHPPKSRIICDWLSAMTGPPVLQG